MSSQEDRDAMVACLQLGAADYMIKPLRHNELRNLWRQRLLVAQGELCFPLPTSPVLQWDSLCPAVASSWLRDVGAMPAGSALEHA